MRQVKIKYIRIKSPTCIATGFMLGLQSILMEMIATHTVGAESQAYFIAGGVGIIVSYLLMWGGLSE